MQKNFFVEQAEQVMTPFYADLEAIVNIDSGTYVKAGVDRVVAYLQQRFRDFGFMTSVHVQHAYGDHLVATHIGSDLRGPRLLLIGHTDTVFPDGEAVRRPFSFSHRDGVRIAKGPGVLDMKSGILMGMYALHLLIENQLAQYQSVTFVCNSDEEIGSITSKPLIERLLCEADAVMVLEPGRRLDAIVSARKGMAIYRVEARGVSSHAGVEPEKGRNAILELAHQVVALQAINGTIPGVTVNVGIIHGGERINIVPDYAYCDIDVRIEDRAGLKAVEEAMKKVVSTNVLDGTVVTLSGGVRSMPFERTEANTRLVQLVKEAGLELGITLEDVASGGGSDANNTAGRRPTVDGLGAGGGLAHNPDEYIELDYLPTRIALISTAIQHICKYYQGGQRL
jgi:glutamate carboxypeptidase